MTIKKIKEEMLKYRDFYGGDLINSSEIKKAKTKKDLEHLIEEHRSHIDMMAVDASGHLDNLKRRTGLFIL